MEGLLLGLGGAAVALPVAHWFFAAARGFELPGGLPVEVLELSVDETVLLAVMAGGLAAVLLIALVAGSVAYSVDSGQMLNAQPGLTRRLTRGRLRSALVVGQVAVALVLLAGAGLFARSIGAALTLNPGYDPSRLVVSEVRLDENSMSRQLELFDGFADRLVAHPDIESASLVAFPGSSGIGSSFFVDGEPLSLPATLRSYGVDTRYFATMGLPIRAGRAFRAGDEASVLPLAVVSESLGRLIERGGAAIGRRISFVFGRLEDFEVVGVVTDHRLVGEHVALAIYALEEHLRVNTYGRTAYVRSATSDTTQAARALRDAVEEVDERGLVASVRLMREVILDQMSTQVFGLSVMAALGTIALVLTGVGIYVLAETIARSRRREMSIRAALGASVWQMASSLIVESFRLVGIGTLLGLGIAWLGAGAIQAFLVGIQPMDWVTLVSVSALIFLLAVAVGLEPAFAAVRADVASTLREE
jgi:hypothetical protein